MVENPDAFLAASDAELVALLQLLNRAVLHSGMDVAEAAVHWKNKVVAARQTIEKKEAT
jgi:hypothetical protein